MTSIVYATSDCTIEDALRVVSYYEIGSWASIQNTDDTETFVIKTSQDGTVVHPNIRFITKDDEFQYLFNNNIHTWDAFWTIMKEIYNLNIDKLIIVEEDELY